MASMFYLIDLSYILTYHQIRTSFLITICGYGLSRNTKIKISSQSIDNRTIKYNT
jgi:hypothetical protein